MTWLYVLGDYLPGLIDLPCHRLGQWPRPPHQPAAAAYQIPRVARLRGVAPATLDRLVAGYTEGKQWGFLSEPRVNVLRLNLALNALRTAEPSNPSSQEQETR